MTHQGQHGRDCRLCVAINRQFQEKATYPRKWLDFSQETKAWREGWQEYVVIPAGAYAPIVDMISDERGACVVVEWHGEELAVATNDLLDISIA